MPTQNTWVSPEITLHEEEISDVSLATFYVFDKENPRPGLRLAGHGGCGGHGHGGGCGCGGCGGHGHGGCGGCGGHGHGCGHGGCGAAEAASVFGGEAAAAVEVVQAAIGAGRTAFGSGATIDVAGSPKAGFA